MSNLFEVLANNLTPGIFKPTNTSCYGLMKFKVPIFKFWWILNLEN
jgi:hypothetical protein